LIRLIAMYSPATASSTGLKPVSHQSGGIEPAY
jgi:hypothetical protein